jgi:PIN domain nuclease of toxin-antitoxin system
VTVLLDTHSFLWFVLDDPQLTAVARSVIEDGSVTVLVSPASYWEIAIKIGIGKYTLTAPYELFWRKGIESNHFSILPIELRHTATLIALAPHHNDPFDRLIIAQALSEGIPVVSGDRHFKPYPAQNIW